MSEQQLTPYVILSNDDDEGQSYWRPRCPLRNVLTNVHQSSQLEGRYASAHNIRYDLILVAPFRMTQNPQSLDAIKRHSR